MTRLTPSTHRATPLLAALLAAGWLAATPALAQAPAAKAAPAPAAAAEKPQYGGTLSIGNVYYTVSPLSFDAADWPCEGAGTPSPADAQDALTRKDAAGR